MLRKCLTLHMGTLDPSNKAQHNTISLFKHYQNAASISPSIYSIKYSYHLLVYVATKVDKISLNK